MSININDLNINNGGNARIKNYDIGYLKNFQNKLLAAMIRNGMPTREEVEKREKDACMQFIRHIYYRVGSEVLQDKIAIIKNNADSKITWNDLELILKMKIESPDYQTMKSFLEEFYNINHQFNDCNILYNITYTNDAAWPPEYEFYSCSTQDLVGTLLHYMAEGEGCALLLKNNDDDYMIRTYDNINNC
jgi:hypothetical protein